jgi:hypothetical protein
VSIFILCQLLFLINVIRAFVIQKKSVWWLSALITRCSAFNNKMILNSQNNIAKRQNELLPF